MGFGLTTARRRIVVLLVGLAAGIGVSLANAQERFITMASTTSTEQSGLFPHLLPAFKRGRQWRFRRRDVVSFTRDPRGRSAA